MQIKELKITKTNYETFIFTYLSSNDAGDLITSQEESYKNQFKIYQQKYTNKLLDYYNKNYENTFNNNPNSKWVINCTTKQIPDYVQNTLSLGPNFNLPYQNKEIPIIKIITSVESCIANEPNTDIIRPEINNIIYNFINKKCQETHKTNIFQIDFLKTKKFLKENNDIMVTRADKGNSTVILERQDYNNKTIQMLEDKETYKKITRDPTNKIQIKVNNLANECLINEFINKNQAMRWKSLNSIAPAIYFVPKVHKEGSPLRPVVSTVQSPTYSLAKYIHKILANCMHYNYQIKDSWEFAKFIKNISNVPEGYVIVSFDVVSLFTNIPTTMAIDIIKNKWNQISPHTSLDQNTFEEAVKICIENTYFRYNDEYYQQIYGVPMGSPISGTIANIVMEKIEEDILKSLHFQPLFYKRYVDDIIMCIPKHLIDFTLEKFNAYHPKIKYTKEMEENNQISFLDMLLTRTNSKIQIQWYTKPTWSGRYLNFKSESPINYKINSLNAMLDRAINFTNAEHRGDQIRKLKDTFIKNHYPVKIIDKQIKKRVDKFYNNNTKNTDPKLYFSIPYVKGLSENLQKCIQKHIKRKSLAYKPLNTIRQLYSKIKYKVPKEKETNLIYKINCECGATYIGETKQYLQKRMQQHKSNVKLKQTQITALAKHAIEENHKFDFENPQILDREQNYNKRLISEMIHIVKDRNAINNKRDVENLSTTYLATIRKIT